MKKLLVIVSLLVLLVPSIGYAQATGTSKLTWDIPAPNLADAQAYAYKYYPDGAATGIALMGVTCTSAGTPAVITCQAAYPAFTPGSHTLTISATNAAGEGPKSTAFSFTFVVIPPAPVNIRIGG